ncbi:MAG: hypothetical protein WDA11_00870 [Thiohalomonadaceae bacterium]
MNEKPLCEAPDGETVRLNDGFTGSLFEMHALQTIRNVVDALNAHYQGKLGASAACLNVASVHLDACKSQISESQ